MAKVFTHPISSKPSYVPQKSIEDQIMLSANRKLARILSSMSLTDIQLSPGDIVKMYIKQHDKQKRGKRLSPLVNLDFEPITASITVTGSNFRTIRSALGDARHSLPNVSFSATVRHANDDFDNDIQELI